MTFLTPFAKDIWICDGPSITAAMGFHFPLRMVVMRIEGHKLAVWSPISISPELTAEIDALGRVAVLIAPNSLHDTYIKDWHDAYPEAKLAAAPGLAELRDDLTFDYAISDGFLPESAESIRATVLNNAITTEVVLFHIPSRTVLFCDLLQNMPHGWFTGWRALVARLDRMTGDTPTVPRKFRMGFRNKAVAQVKVTEILNWPAERVLMAHGTPVTSHGQRFLKRAFSWLF